MSSYCVVGAVLGSGDTGVKRQTWFCPNGSYDAVKETGIKEEQTRRTPLLQITTYVWAVLLIVLWNCL